MRHLIMLTAFLFVSCASSNKEWSSGQDAQSSFQEQRRQEQVETFRNQMPGQNF